MAGLWMPLTPLLVALASVVVVFSPAPLGAGENQPRPVSSVELRVVVAKVTRGKRDLVSVLRLKVDRLLADGSQAEALPALDEFIAALTSKRDGLLKDHQQAASTLLEIEKLKHELAQNHLKHGEISRRLSHNRTPDVGALKRRDLGDLKSFHGHFGVPVHLTEVFDPNRQRGQQQASSKLTQFIDIPSLTQSTFPLSDTARRQMEEFLILSSSSDAAPFDEAVFFESQVKRLLALGNELGALKTLEKLAQNLRHRRNLLAEGHGQRADSLAALTQTQDALGRAHLDCGLLGQVLHVRAEVARLVAEAAAGRATQADLAAARVRLAAAEERLATEGILVRR